MSRKNNTAEPWERQNGESEKAYEAFSIYRDMGAERTVSAVVKRLEKSRSLIDRWKDRWEWVERVRAYDNDKERKAKAEAEKDLRSMCERHIKLAMSMQAKAIEALKQLNIEDMTPKDVREYIKAATELERLNRTLNVEIVSEEKQNIATNFSDNVISAYQKRKDNGQ